MRVRGGEVYIWCVAPRHFRRIHTGYEPALQTFAHDPPLSFIRLSRILQIVTPVQGCLCALGAQDLSGDAAAARRRRRDSAFLAEGKVFNSPRGSYIFRDTGSKVLGVAHLDTVFDVRRHDHFGIVKGTGLEAVVCPHLDDRLGAYILLDLLPSLGITLDVLLTDGEEACMSTAALFEPPRQYHWVVEFDRRGTDVVLYQYDDPKLRRVLRRYGLNAGQGSFSDITSLDHLGVKCLNFGCGYDDAHTLWCHANLRDTALQVDRFRRFYKDWQNTKLPHSDPTPPRRRARGRPLARDFDWLADWPEYSHLYEGLEEPITDLDGRPVPLLERLDREL